mgnify:CR=1 FL=1
MKTIAIGADDAAYAFRDAIVAYLNGLGINVADYSSDKRQGSTVSPDVAHAVTTPSPVTRWARPLPTVTSTWVS